MTPDRSLAHESTKGVKQSKKRLTYLFAVNATGTDKRPPLVIGQAALPVCFRALRKTPVQMGFDYVHNKKAWMRTDVWNDWLQAWDKELQQSGNRQILLLVDNFSGHKNMLPLKNIRVEFLAPNMTSHIQPLDQGIIAAFKAHYRRGRARMINERFLAKEEDCFDINQLEGMQLAQEAWNAVTVATGANCFRRAGVIGPRDRQDRLLPACRRRTAPRHWRAMSSPTPTAGTSGWPKAKRLYNKI